MMKKSNNDLNADAKYLLIKPGVILLVFGLIDIGFMIYCFKNRIGYSSSFNIFAVIAGILLIRGSLKTARIAAQLLAFFLGAIAFILPAFLFIASFDYIAALLKFRLLNTVLTAAIVAGLALFMVWIYRLVTRPDIIDEMESQNIISGSFWRHPKSGFVLGLILGIVMSGVIIYSHKGSLKERAEIEAEKVTGPGYKYQITSFQVSNSYFRARVDAYNEKEIKTIVVQSE